MSTTKFSVHTDWINKHLEYEVITIPSDHIDFSCTFQRFQCQQQREPQQEKNDDDDNNNSNESDDSNNGQRVRYPPWSLDINYVALYFKMEFRNIIKTVRS